MLSSTSGSGPIRRIRHRSEGGLACFGSRHAHTVSGVRASENCSCQVRFLVRLSTQSGNARLRRCLPARRGVPVRVERQDACHESSIRAGIGRVPRYAVGATRSRLSSFQLSRRGMGREVCPSIFHRYHARHSTPSAHALSQARVGICMGLHAYRCVLRRGGSDVPIRKYSDERLCHARPGTMDGYRRALRHIRRVGMSIGAGVLVGSPP